MTWLERKDIYSVIKRKIKGVTFYEVLYNKSGGWMESIGMMKTMREARDLINKHKGRSYD